MHPIKIYFLFYSVLLLVGGVIGYKKANSKASLIAGVVSGLLLGIFAFIGGWFPISVISGTMFVVFALRFIKTKKFMPSVTVE